MTCFTAFGAGTASAQEEPSGGGPVVVATVGKEPIYAAEVHRLLGKVTRGQKVNPQALPVLQAQTLAEIVDRRLVLAYARHKGWEPSASRIESGIDQLKSKLVAHQQSLEDFLKKEAITQADLRRQIAWNLVWEKLSAWYLSQERMEAYFEKHRREFDGTQVEVSHILLRPKTSGRAHALDEQLQQAEAIRRQIVSGKTSFADAAGRYSAGPSAADGGRLGLIPRRGVMDEAFSRAAFALEPGQVSEPVKTPFGVHLIRCNRVKPGNKPLADVRKELEDALGRELLEKLARFQRVHTPVEFTGKLPYFRPGTRDLVVP